MNETEEIKKNECCSHHDESSLCDCEKMHQKDKKGKDKWKEKIHDLEEEKKHLEEKILYHQAELINYRKRKDEEVSNLLKYANQDLILELLPVLDNFERAIQLDDDDLSDELSKFLVGFKMMYSHLVELLKQYGVEEIPALGLPFDPNFHEALMTSSEKNQDDGVVLEVLLKGYKLKDRVIRPASVRVNKIEEEEREKDE